MDASTLRKEILSKRDALTADTLERLSRLVVERLDALPQFQQSKFPLFFISFRSEIDTRPLIRRRLAARQPVLVPKTLVRQRRLEIYRIRDWERDLVSGAYGIPEPVPGTAERVEDLSVIDLVLVPGSVFDRRCGRFGYGGGFYDRFLSRDVPQAFRLGLGFHFQLLEQIPLAPHDEKLHMVVTDTETVKCSSGCS